MEQNEIIEGNRLIAEFLGWKYEVSDGQLDAYFEGERMWCDRPKALHDVLLKGFRFHESWNKLMPVVEKVARIPFPDAQYNGQTYYPRTFGMIADNGQIMVRINASPVILADTLIEATWLAVVDFIKWYNSQSLTQHT